jgi:chromate reductase, NAD(P)H dehydrogenase (quinone)
LTRWRLGCCGKYLPMGVGVRNECVAYTPSWKRQMPKAPITREAHPPATVLAISGSLRIASLNSMLLRAVARLTPPGISVELYRELGTVPLFNPDLELLDPPPAAALRRRIIASDALLIASPEYAHGVTGVLKNALDWMVGNESFVGKPVGLLNASARATIAQAALRETLVTMSAQVIADACVTIPILGSGLDEDGIVTHPQIAPLLIGALKALEREVRSQRGSRQPQWPL